MLEFSGNDSVFDLSGVTIEVNTDLLNDFGTKVIEFYVTGDRVNIRGLTVTDIGSSPTTSGGQSFTVSGDTIVIEDVTLNVSGSSPYGYGPVAVMRRFRSQRAEQTSAVTLSKRH